MTWADSIEEDAWYWVTVQNEMDILEVEPRYCRVQDLDDNPWYWKYMGPITVPTLPPDLPEEESDED